MFFAREGFASISIARYSCAMNKTFIVCVVMFSLCLIRRDAQAEPVSGTLGMVATAHPAASNAAMTMLRAGGTACDAAVAAAFTLAVAEPYSSGIGGGGLALVRHKKSTDFMDFREVAPVRADPNMYVHQGKADPLESRDGPLSVAIPGAVAGYVALHQKCGTLPLARVMAPAIDTALQGFVVDLRYHKRAVERADELRRDPEAARIFLSPDANGVLSAPPVGSVLKQKDLAKTLKRIAQKGAAGFYKGAIADTMVKSLSQKGGIITQADLQSYKVRERAPLVGSFRGHTIITSPPPSSGGQILLTILNFMETLPSPTVWHNTAWLRRFIEASKRAYADRALLGDPAYVPELADELPLLLAKQRAIDMMPKLERNTPASDILAGEGTRLEKAVPKLQPQSDHTTHLTVVDASGNAVSMTTTLNYVFGSGVVAGNTGVLWNDEMDDFAVAVGVPNAYGISGSAANRVVHGKVPLSSMTPSFVLQSQEPNAPLELVIGSPGGSRIPSSVAQAVLAFVDGGADVLTAVSLGRLHHQHQPDEVDVERWGLDPATRDILSQAGYKLRDENPWCNVMAISIDPKTGIRTAAADPRGVGTALAQ
jgi:gamma-glutamyltranspeptidase/glutathione hydrolase